MAILIVLMLVFPLFFTDKAVNAVKEMIRGQLATDLNFENPSLTFFRHFPSLTVSLQDVWIQSSPGFHKDTLLYAKDLSFGINVLSLLGNTADITGIFLNSAEINLLRDAKGQSNFDIFKSDTTAQLTEASGSADFTVDIQKLQINQGSIFYEDSDLGLSMKAEGFNYTGKGRLEKSILELSSHIDINSFGLEYDGTPYFAKNQVEANLLTKINTESTSITFERNHLRINELPVDFVGKLEFMTGGYDMNFVLESVDVNFRDMLSLIPEAWRPWLADTKVRGKGDLRASLQGLYLPEQGQMPNILANLRVRNGLLAHGNAPVPLEELHVVLDLTIPALEANQTKVALDSVHLKLGNGYLNGHLAIDGLEPASISGNIRSELDLELLDKALGIDPYELRGKMGWNIQVAGTYALEQLPHTDRNPQYKTTKIPKFSIRSSLENGYLHWKSMPAALQDISYSLSLNSPDSLWEHIGVSIDMLRFKMLDNYADGYLKMEGLGKMDIDGKFDAKFNLAEVGRFYPLDSGFVLRGLLDIGFLAKGTYDDSKKLFPVIQSLVQIREGYLKTPYASEAIQDFSLELGIRSEKGSFEDVEIDLKPIAFRLAEHPFSLTANLSNLSDVRYELVSSGRIDLGKMYQSFGIDGYDLSGFIATDLNLQGLQSDAAKGRYDRLNNRGTVEMENIMLRADWVPHPFHVSKGKFRMDRDRLYLEGFEGKYLDNELHAEGYLFDLIAYATHGQTPLSGKLDLRSAKLNLSDFMFFSEEEAITIDTVGLTQGVVLLPTLVDFAISAKVDEVLFGELLLRDFNGQLRLKDGNLAMDNTRFQLAGAEFRMDGEYIPRNPLSADFNYQIKAKGFDIQRAYQEINLFRELAPAAAYASGKASLDYQLSGRLDPNMYPVLPSIKGEGILGLDEIKLKGFKLMNAIAKDTDNNELTDPQLSQVQIKTKISNNLMTIDRTRMRIAGFRPRFEGQVSLDGDMSIAFRLGLPPLGIFGIPIKITGNAEDPKIEVGKVTEGDELEEKIDEGEVEGG